VLHEYIFAFFGIIGAILNHKLCYSYNNWCYFEP